MYKDKEEQKAKDKELYLKKRETILAQSKEVYKRFPGCKSEYQKQYRETHKEALSQYKKDYYRANPDNWFRQKCKKYNVPVEEARQRLAIGCCELCHKPFGTERPYMDHCHATNKFRGFIHMKCNFMLGQADDNATTLRLGADWIDKHNQTLTTGE